MPSPKIIFLDIDGTLIDSSETIAESTISAITAARANGHLVYLCTGRAPTEIYAGITGIGFDGAISAGGGFAAIGEDLVIARTLPEVEVDRMIGFFEQSGFDFYLQAATEVFPSPGVGPRFAGYLTADLERAGATPRDAATAVAAHPAMAAFSNVRPYNRATIAKAVFLGDDETAFDRVLATLGAEFHVITGTIPHLGRSTGEVSLRDVTKGSTILQLLELLGLDAADAIGIGDSSNDIEMLQVCGVGIAMGNATDAIKAHADEVTTSVHDDGVWNAFLAHNLV